MTSLRGAVFAGFFLCLAASFSYAEIKPAGGRDLLPAHIFNSIQAYMLEKRFDGWLFSGQGSFDDIEKDFLGLKGKTRYRWFIFIPGLASHKKPYLIYHKADERVFSGINFYPLPYRSRDEMLKEFSERLCPIAQKICVNYSPEMNIPELSRADAGMLEWLKKKNLQLISSGSILSFYHTRWLVTDIETHKKAAAGLDSILTLAEDFLKGKILNNRKVTDYDLAGFLEESLKKKRLEAVEKPVVALGEKTIEDRYVPSKNEARLISRGDLLYIELSARERKNSQAMFARLGWTLYIGDKVPDSLAADWERITAAADEALNVLKTRIPRERETLLGYEVDRAARIKLGSEPDILPRPLGFNLNRLGHDFGVRFDSYTAVDDREVMPGMGFTLEPGIYRENHALRMCANLFIDGERKVNISAPLQRKIAAVLAGDAGK